MVPVANLETGALDLTELEHELATPPDAHFAQPALVALENTHNNCGGVAVAASHMADVGRAGPPPWRRGPSRRRADFQRGNRA